MNERRELPGDELLRSRVRDALDSVQRPAPDLRRRCAEAVGRDRRRRRPPAPMVWAAVAVLAAVVVAVTLVQHAADRGVHGPVTTPTARPAPGQLLYVLTADNGVAALDRATLRPQWRARAAAAPSAAVATGSLLALSRDSLSLYVLPPADNRGGGTVVILDAASGRRTGSVALSAAGGAVYSSLAVNPRSGDLYAIGQDSGHILVTVVDPVRRLVLATQVTRTLPSARAVGVDRPGHAAVSDDGSRLWYSVGGGDPDRTGIDWADVAGPRLAPCASRGGAACIPGPGGGFALLGGHVYFADNGLPVALVDADATGTVVRRVSIALGGVTDVLLDRAGGRVVLVGDCSSLGGLATVDPASGQAQSVASPAPAGTEPDAASACGQRPVLLGGGSFAVSRLAQGSANPSSPGTVDVDDLATGRVLRSAALTAEVADLLAPG